MKLPMMQIGKLLSAHGSLQMFSGRRSEIDETKILLIKFAANLTKVTEEKTGTYGYLVYGETAYLRHLNSRFGNLNIKQFMDS